MCKYIWVYVTEGLCLLSVALCCAVNSARALLANDAWLVKRMHMALLITLLAVMEALAQYRMHVGAAGKCCLATTTWKGSKWCAGGTQCSWFQ